MAQLSRLFAINLFVGLLMAQLIFPRIALAIFGGAPSGLHDSMFCWQRAHTPEKDHFSIILDKNNCEEIFLLGKQHEMTLQYNSPSPIVGASRYIPIRVSVSQPTTDAISITRIESTDSKSVRWKIGLHAAQTGRAEFEITVHNQLGIHLTSRRYVFNVVHPDEIIHKLENVVLQSVVFDLPESVISSKRQIMDTQLAELEKGMRHLPEEARTEFLKQRRRYLEAALGASTHKSETVSFSFALTVKEHERHYNCEMSRANGNPWKDKRRMNDGGYRPECAKLFSILEFGPDGMRYIFLSDNKEYQSKVNFSKN